MAPHSGNFAWRVPWTEEPGGLWSLGSYSQARLKQLSSVIHTFSPKCFLTLRDSEKQKEARAQHFFSFCIIISYPGHIPFLFL